MGSRGARATRLRQLRVASVLVEVSDGDAREGDARVQCAARERVAPPEHVQQQTLEREPEVGGELRAGGRRESQCTALEKHRVHTVATRQRQTSKSEA